MDAKNNGTQGTRGVIQVRAPCEDKIPMSYVRRCIMIYWVETLSTPPFIG
jgi:hypothetical protein